jgi:hypothetical protein
MKNTLKTIVLGLLVLCCWSCSKPYIPEPDPVLLISPEKNNSCLPLFSTTSQGVISFEWLESLNTDSYEIHVRNSITGEEQSRSIDLTSAIITIDRGAPYSWWVISESLASPVRTKSEVWSFYLEALQQESYLPFSAQLVSPLNGETISLSSSQYSLQWNGSDLDGDIDYYRVYIGSSETQLNLVQDNLSATSYSASLSSEQTYYWKIITVDEAGNQSESSVFNFITF